MPDPETRITDRNEVAALIGVVAKTLPEGPCTAEKSEMEYEFSGLYSIESTSARATGFTWRDEAGNKILEIKVPDDKDAGVRYQRMSYDMQGRPELREEFFNSNTPPSEVWYYDNGKIAEGRYGTSYGYSPATHIVKYDREGKLHSLDGFADYFSVIDGISSGNYQGQYYVHGQGYSRADLKKHPEYKARHSLSGWADRIGSGLSRLFNGEANDNARKPVLPVDTLIAAADNLSPDDKDRLASALGPEKKKAISFKL